MPKQPNYPDNPGKTVKDPPGWPVGTTFYNNGTYIIVTNPDGSHDYWTANGANAGGYQGHSGPDGTKPDPPPANQPMPGPQPMPQPGPPGQGPQWWEPGFGSQKGPLIPPPDWWSNPVYQGPTVGTFGVLDGPIMPPPVQGPEKPLPPLVPPDAWQFDPINLPGSPPISITPGPTGPPTPGPPGFQPTPYPRIMPPPIHRQQPIRRRYDYRTVG